MALVDGSRPRARRDGTDRPWTSAWVHRWDGLTTPPWRERWRDVGVRLLVPALVLWVAITAVGFLIQDGLHSFQAESAVNRALQSTRTTTWDAVTAVWSHVGNTEIVIGVCVVMVGVVLALTRRWAVALVPAIAISLQASVFVAATEIVGRPRPDVPHLDPAPPTSSYPSGHVGASTALYLSLALLAQRVRNRTLRRVLTAVCVVIPLLVLYARLYRGMHHLTDVLVGLVNGVVCATLAWGWLRDRRSR